MQAAGVELIKDIPQINVMGCIGFRAVPHWLRRLARVTQVLRQEPVDVVVLIDQPGLNLYFARIAKRAGRRVVYYIMPQIWAWRPGRMKWIKRRVDHAIVILPFEEELYRRAGVPCTFVGHPLLDEVARSYDRNAVRDRYGIGADEWVLGLLPGSRRAEVESLLPVMLEAARRLHTEAPVRMILAVAETVDRHAIKSRCDQAGVDVRLIERDPNGVIAAADLLFVASGTATLQAALIGIPMVILYKAAPLVFFVARLLVRVRSIGLANLIADRPFIPELIQHNVTVDRLLTEARRIRDDRAYRESMRSQMVQVRSVLGEPGASRRAAQVILSLLRQDREVRTA
jgi:lipid-A-disaccharide synthase